MGQTNKPSNDRPYDKLHTCRDTETVFLTALLITYSYVGHGLLMLFSLWVSAAGVAWQRALMTLFLDRESVSVPVIACGRPLSLVEASTHTDVDFHCSTRPNAVRGLNMGSTTKISNHKRRKSFALHGPSSEGIVGDFLTCRKL